LRSPLITIDGFSRLLLEKVEAPFDRSRRDHLERIVGAARRMHTLIDDFVGLSKIVRAPMKKTVVDLSTMSREIVDRLREQSRGRDVETVIEANVTAHGDVGLLRIALENLFANAWKFTSKKQNARIEFGADAEKAGLRSYFIRDNGAGFDASRAKKLFTPFHRLHPPEDFAGTGIGLATVRRVVHRHGGEISAEAQVDQGALFRFTIPTG
jgi:signal transduction histidine kinase